MRRSTSCGLGWVRPAAWCRRSGRASSRSATGPGGASSSATSRSRCSASSAANDAAIASVGVRDPARSPRRRSPDREPPAASPAAAHEPPDPLRREVADCDDLGAAERTSDRARGKLGGLARGGTGSASSRRRSRSLASTITSAGSGNRSAPRSRWTRRSAACSGAGREVQISQCARRVHASSRSSRRAHRSAASARYSVDPNASSAMNICRRSPRIERAKPASGIGALVRLPAAGQLRQGDHPRDRGLAHLRRPGEHGEAVLAQYFQRAAVGAGRHEHGRQRPRRIPIKRRRRQRLGPQQVIQAAHSEHRRRGQPQLGTGVDHAAELGPPERDHLDAGRAYSPTRAPRSAFAIAFVSTSTLPAAAASEPATASATRRRASHFVATQRGTTHTHHGWLGNPTTGQRLSGCRGDGHPAGEQPLPATPPATHHAARIALCTTARTAASRARSGHSRPRRLPPSSHL